MASIPRSNLPYYNGMRRVSQFGQESVTFVSRFTIKGQRKHDGSLRPEAVSAAWRGAIQALRVFTACSDAAGMAAAGDISSRAR